MASTSKAGRALRDGELVDVFYALPSDLSGLNDFESDSGNEAVYNPSATANSDSESEKIIHHSKQSHKGRNYAPTCSNGVVVILFQKNHPFIAENSGISVNINDECTAFNIF
jgi:hypothetical protein